MSVQVAAGQTSSSPCDHPTVDLVLPSNSTYEQIAEGPHMQKGDEKLRRKLQWYPVNLYCQQMDRLGSKSSLATW